jgi:hypothetical protein
MSRKVSLKEIVKAIDKAISEFDEAKNYRSKETTDERAERAKIMLKGIRETVEGICVPDFEVPAA